MINHLYFRENLVQARAGFKIVKLCQFWKTFLVTSRLIAYIDRSPFYVLRAAVLLTVSRNSFYISFLAKCIMSC